MCQNLCDDNFVVDFNDVSNVDSNDYHDGENCNNNDYSAEFADDINITYDLGNDALYSTNESTCGAISKIKCRLKLMYPSIYSSIEDEELNRCIVQYSALCGQANVTDDLVIGHLNVRSLLPKIHEIQFILHISNFDILCINESWLDDSISAQDIAVSGYSTVTKHRNRHGGGIVVYIKNEVKFDRRIDLELPELECIWIELKCKGQNVLMCSMYRPPSANPEYYSNILDVLEKACDEDNVTILVGDLNINYTTGASSVQNPLHYIESLYGMTQLVNSHTRVTERSASIIDVILSTHPALHHYTEVFNCTLSDHYLIYTSLDVSKCLIKNSHKEIRFRCYKNFDVNLYFYDIANSVVLNNIYRISNVNEAWNSWKTEYLRICDKHAPIRVCRLKDRFNPWITKEILQLMYRRDYLHKQAVKYSDYVLMNEYRAVKSKINNLITVGKKQYYDNLYNEAREKPKVLWNELKLLSGKTKGNVMHDDNHSAGKFNQFFSTIGKITTQHLPEPDEVHWIGGSSIYEFKFVNVDESSVLKLLRSLNSNSSLDILNIDCKLLKLAADYLVPSLTYLFNCSLSNGLVPIDWKYSRVTPIYKGAGAVSDCSNYRPISVIAHIAKLFEKEVQCQLMSYLVNHDFISLDQYAYRKYHSTSTCLHSTIDEWLQSIDESLKVGVTFLDISKCFDTINHNLLLAKLTKYGINDNELHWFKSYLSERCQSVIYNNQLSNPLDCSIGVPQGSNLGPLLFTLFVNDFSTSIRNGRISMYADDTILYCDGDNVLDIARNLNECLDDAALWYSKNCLALNVKKTIGMLIGSNVNSDDLNEFNLKLSGEFIENVSMSKYLGVHVDENLKFDGHVNEIVKNISKKLSWLGRLRHIVPKNILELSYRTYIVPLFDYACTVWGYSNANVSCIQRLQNRAARIITGCFDIVNVRGVEIVKQLKWQTMQERINYFLSIHIFNCIHGNAPQNLVNSIVMACEVHDVNTRLANSFNVVVPEYRTEIYKRSFIYRASIVWNELPESIKECNNLADFKCKVKGHFS